MRKEILAKKQLYRSEIFPREESVKEREERLLFLRLRLVICKLSKAYCVLSSAVVVSNISGTISRRQEVTYTEGCKSRELRRDGEVRPRRLAHERGEQSAARPLHIYGHVSVACDFSSILSLFVSRPSLSLFLFLFSSFSSFPRKINKSVEGRDFELKFKFF